jgi:hypothetical protein
MNKIMHGFLMSAVLVSLAATAFAATPPFIPFQGRLTDAAGTPLNGAQNVTFSLYTVSTAGSALYTETQSVTCAAGLFTAEIGTGTVVTGTFNGDLFNGQGLYLGITVGSDPEMTPRTHLGSVPYAMRAGTQAGIASNHTTSTVSVTTTIGGGGGTTILSASITIPAGGVIYATAGGGYMYTSGSVGAASAYTYVWIAESAGSTLPGTDWHVFGENTLSSSSIYWPIACSRAFTKGAAGTYSFYLTATKGNAANSSAFTFPTLTLQYFPDALGPVNLAPQTASSAVPVPDGANR